MEITRNMMVGVGGALIAIPVFMLVTTYKMGEPFSSLFYLGAASFLMGLWAVYIGTKPQEGVFNA